MQRLIKISCFFFTLQALRLAVTVILDIFCIFCQFLGMKIKYYFVNFFFKENIHGIGQLVKI